MINYLKRLNKQGEHLLSVNRRIHSWVSLQRISCFFYFCTLILPVPNACSILQRVLFIALEKLIFSARWGVLVCLLPCRCVLYTGCDLSWKGQCQLLRKRIWPIMNMEVRLKKIHPKGKNRVTILFYFPFSTLR